MAGISITLAGNFAKLDELKDKAHKTAASVKSAFSSNMGKAMFGGIAAASTAAFAGVVVAVKKAVDAGGALADMMARTGAEGKGLVVMQRAFENAGMAAEQVPGALNRMQKALAGINEEGKPTNEEFAKLGLSMTELMSLDPVAAFEKTATAIASIPDPAQRAASAMAIFGKSGAEMLAVMNDPAAFANAEKQVGSLGRTLADNAGSLDAVGDAFGSLETKVTQIGAEVAVALLPQLEAVAKWLEETDFSSVGKSISGLAVEFIGLAKAISSSVGALANMAEYIPTVAAFRKAMEAKGFADTVKAAEGGQKTPSQTQPQAPGKTASQRAAEAAEGASAASADKEAKKEAKAADVAEKKAAADKKKADEKERTRAAAVDEYNLEMAILSARLSGDAKRLEALEREKKIRAEINGMTGAGLTPEEARGPAARKVDAETKADMIDSEKKKTEEARAKAESETRGKLDDVLSRSANHRFESTIGGATSMQRVGGGGGAFSSGLDYARQTAELQREANGLTRQLIDLMRPEPSV